MHKTKLGVILAVPLALSVSCASMKSMGGGGGDTQTYALMPADRTPAASGIVEISTDDDSNKKLDLKVEHLPMPNELDPQLTTYVVWIDPGGGHQPIPVGQLKIDQDREASAEFATPFSQFDLMVTAEPSATPAKPSNQVVLQGRIYSTPAG